MLMFLESLTLYSISVIAALFIGLYFHCTRNFNFWQKLGIPYVKPTPFVGNLTDCALLKTTIGEQLQKIYDEHSDKPYVGIFSFDKPCLFIRDLELVKNILVKDFHNFIDRTVLFEAKFDPLFGNTLPILKGQRWRHLRSKLTPVFTSRKMKMMFYLLDTSCSELVEFLEKATADGSTIEVKETMARFTTDVIASCALGINSNSLKDSDSEFGRRIRNILEFTVQKGFVGVVAFFAPYLNNVFRVKFMDEKTNNFVRQTVWNTVEHREKHGLVRNDFLDCMMELRQASKDEAQGDVQSAKNEDIGATFKIDGDIFVAQALTFLLGGFETSASALTVALYELAFNPVIQQSLRAEILQELSKHDGKLTYDVIHDMSYLDRVVAETLRKRPVISFLERMCLHDYELPAPNGNGTIILPAGTGVYTSILGPHFDPTYFPEPEKFDPDRFTEENKQSRPNYTYLPFGEGPRMCIGMRFALMQVKTGLCHILSRFEVAPCKDTPLHVVYEPKSFLNQMKGKVPLSFNKLQS